MQQHAEYFHQARIEKNFLVVSNYYNDLSWLSDYTKHYIIYDQSGSEIYPPKINPHQVVKSEHLGHNIRDFCTYIVDHYESLPERMIFASGNIFPRFISRNRFDLLVNATEFTPLTDMRRHKSGWPIAYFTDDGFMHELNSSWYLAHHPTKYFHDFNDFLKFCFVNPKLPWYTRFAPGANYIVPKENILKLPKLFYQYLITFVSHSYTDIQGESHIIERAFALLWTSEYTVRQHIHQLLADSFIAKHLHPV